MPHIGEIEGISKSTGIDQERWMNLIESHGSLRPAAPKQGVDPFTRKPRQFWPPPSTANIVVEGKEVGGIAWAQSGAPVLFVHAEDESVEIVAAIAREIASELGGTFTRASENA